MHTTQVPLETVQKPPHQDQEISTVGTSVVHRLTPVSVHLTLGGKHLEESFNWMVSVGPGGTCIGRAQEEGCRGLEREHRAVHAGVLTVQTVRKMQCVCVCVCSLGNRLII